MSNLSNSAVKKILCKIAKSHGLQNYTTTEDNGSTKGDGYMGIITAIEMKGTCNSDEKVLNLIVKTALKSDALRKELPVAEMYQREIYMYKSVLPAFHDLATERKVLPLSNFVKCYETIQAENNESLIIENVKPKGFKLWDRRLQIDEEHVGLIMRTLGRFHALSFALKDQKPDLFIKLRKPIEEVDILSKMFKKLGTQEMFVNTYRKVGESLCPNKDADALKSFQDFQSNALETYKDILQYVDNYCVILHGDCWINNMMFAYNDDKRPNTPTNMYLIDLQMARFGPPVIDILFCFYSSSSNDVINNYTHYLDIYYNSMCSYLKDLGSDPEQLYPYQIFRQHWQDHVKYGLITSVYLIKLMLADQEEVVNLADAAESDRDFNEAFANNISNMVEYNARLRQIILHFVNNKFI